MINKDFFLALDDLEREKGIDKDVFLNALEVALSKACKRHFGEETGIEIKINPEKNTIRVFSYKTVVEEVTDPDKEISLDGARESKKSYKVGDKVSVEINPKDFSRIAAQTAKQVVTQMLKETEKTMTLSRFSEKENEMLVGTVSRIKDDGTIYVEIGKNQMEGVLMPADQIPNERYRQGDRIKAYVKKVKDTPKGVHVLLSRACPGLVKRLFENEVPEIRVGIVEIKAIAREAGYRTKIAVWSNDPEIDAVGACVGPKGVRVNAIGNNELAGEKIDIIPWSEDNLDFIARSLSPAKVLMVLANEEAKEAKVIVPDDKLSLAIGREGQNARLAARLTTWKIDVKSYSTAVAQGIIDASEKEIADLQTENVKETAGGFDYNIHADLFPDAE